MMKDMESFKQTLEENHLREGATLLSLQENEDGSVDIEIRLEDGAYTEHTICAEDVVRIEERMRK